MTDLKCVSDTKGGYFYKDHLPSLGDNSILKKINTLESSVRSSISSSSNSKKYIIEPSEVNQRQIQINTNNQNLRTSLSNDLFVNNDSTTLTSNNLKLGNRVNIDLEFEIVQSLQVGHGGWCEAMFECLGTTGLVTGIDNDNDIEVTYPSGAKWTFNPAVLTLAQSISHSPVSQNNIEPNLIDLNVNLNNMSLNNATTPPIRSNNNQNRSLLNTNQAVIDVCTNDLLLNNNGDGIVQANKDDFRVNDIVEISSDLERVKFLQKGHGEYAEAMFPVVFNHIFFVFKLILNIILIKLKQTLGKIGKIKHIYPDKDLKIEVCDTTWTYNPLCVKKMNTDLLPLHTSQSSSALNKINSNNLNEGTNII